MRNEKAKTILRLPLEKRAEMAFKEAVEEVIDEHARLGLPLDILRDGKVVSLSAQDVLHNSEVSAGKQTSESSFFATFALASR